jgi:acyl carrier protein
MAEPDGVDREPLRAHFARVIGGNRALLPADGASLLDEGLLDSFGLAELVAVIEGAYGVRVPDEDIALANFESIERIAAYVAARRQAR